MALYNNKNIGTGPKGFLGLAPLSPGLASQTASYVITASAGQGGTISPEGNIPVAAGEEPDLYRHGK